MIVVQSERIRYERNKHNEERGICHESAEPYTVNRLYELTMMQGYYENPSDQIVVFDAFTERIHAAAHTPYVQDLSR